MTSDQIRQQFIDFFVQKHGHTFVPSSPVVPHDDPTLLFTNAGMNQFKPIFLGQEKRSYTRAANTQKCIRAGGKHNDLDDVGRSRRHHTFFEMLGNWSFGDYFKQGAIAMAWELLTQVWKLDPTRLHVSCYEGNEAAGIPRDTEAADLWKQVAGLPDDHIHYFGKDNFWEMGETGPCGPCTEIYIDRTPDKTGGKDVNGEDPRVMEIWNLVFIQFNRDASGKLTPLPSQHVDTGMGFERICQVLQDKQDNFAIDLWQPLFKEIARLSGLQYTGQFPPSNSVDPQAEAANPQLRQDIAFRVVADHVRCLTFALTDGAVPSNEGRGYVLRRILRRAVRFGRQQLGLNEPFMHRLVPLVVESMGATFPELKKNPQRVIELVKDEEISFGKTLDRGIVLFDEASAEAKIETSGGWINSPSPLPARISAAAAFKLHDTYGFPIDLTRIMAEERGLSVDIAGYEKLMEQAKELARAGGKKQDSRLETLPPDALSQLAQSGARPTDDAPKFAHAAIEARLVAIWNGTDLGLSPADVFEDEELAVVLDRTNFYAEMGGQVGDAGELRSESGAVFDVETTHAAGGYVLHIGRVSSGKLSVGSTVSARVTGGRKHTEKNHTSTHIANWALREVLGDEVQQKGSLVDPEKLRFDFSHGKSLSEEELGRVEQLVAERIERKLPVYAEVAPQEQALKINGLRAVFGEKYPPMVRVVSVGVPVAELLANPGNEKWREYSIEFCGGTHLGNSAEAEAFVITAEESVSKGIRRIVALTGPAARQAAENAREIDSLVGLAKKAQGAELPPLIASLNAAMGVGVVPLRAKRRAQAAVAELHARLKAFEKSKASEPGGAKVDVTALAHKLLSEARAEGLEKLIIGELPGASEDQLRSALDWLKKQTPSYAILLATRGEDKVTFVAAVSDDLIAHGLKAGDWVRETAKVAGGGGGGRPQMAQAGGKDPAKLEAALKAAHGYASKFVA
jgi:alanyl-tRNA synthetase